MLPRTRITLPDVYDTWKDNRSRVVYTWKAGPGWIAAYREGEAIVHFGQRYFLNKIAHDWVKIERFG